MRRPIELLQDSFAIFQKNPQLFISIYSVLGVLTVLTEWFSPEQQDPTDITAPLVIVLSIITVVVSVFTTIALIRAISEPETTTFKSAYEFARKDALQYFILSIMVGVVVLLGLVLFIVPGLIALTWFGFACYLLIFEGKRGVDAMKASKELAEGRFMPLLGRYVALFAISILVSIIASFIGSMFSYFIETVLLAVAYAVLMPVMIGYVYLMYRDAKADGKLQPAFTPSAEAATPAATQSFTSSVGDAAAPTDSQRVTSSDKPDAEDVDRT